MSAVPTPQETKVSLEAHTTGMSASSPFIQTHYTLEEMEQFKDRIEAAEKDRSIPNPSNAKFALGLIYLEGRLVVQSIEKGFELLLQAAEGNTNAQVVLGRLNIRGFWQNKLAACKDSGVQQNMMEALRRAAEPTPSEEFPLGVVLANKILANFYQITGEIGSAFHCLIGASQRQDPQAQLMLASYYFWGMAPYAFDQEKIKSWLRQSVRAMTTWPAHPSPKMSEVIYNLLSHPFNSQSVLRYVAPFYLEGPFEDYNTQYYDTPGRGLQCQGPFKVPEMVFILPETVRWEDGFKTIPQHMFLCLPPHPNLIAPFGCTAIELQISSSNYITHFALICPTLKEQVKPVEQQIRDNPEWLKSHGITFLMDIAKALRHCHSQGVPHGNLDLKNMFATETGEGFLVRGLGAKATLEKAQSMYPCQQDIYELGLCLFKIYAGISLQIYYTLSAKDQNTIKDKLKVICPREVRKLMVNCTNKDEKMRPSIDWIISVLRKEFKAEVEQTISADEAYAKLWRIPKECLNKMQLAPQLNIKSPIGPEGSKGAKVPIDPKARLLLLPEALLRKTAEFLDISSLAATLRACKLTYQRLCKLPIKPLLSFKSNPMDPFVIPKPQNLFQNPDTMKLWAKVVSIQENYYRAEAQLYRQKNFVMACRSDAENVYRETNGLTQQFAQTTDYCCAICDSKVKAPSSQQVTFKYSSLQQPAAAPCKKCSTEVIAATNIERIDPILWSTVAKELGSLPCWNVKDDGGIPGLESRYYCITDLRALEKSLVSKPDRR